MMYREWPTDPHRRQRVNRSWGTEAKDSFEDLAEGQCGWTKSKGQNRLKEYC